ncbi:Hypothetical protein FKW44_010438, partial [Caligus rogercresseyi]
KCLICRIRCKRAVKIGCRPSGNPPPSLYAAPVVKNPPRKAHKDPVTAQVCTL